MKKLLIIFGIIFLGTTVVSAQSSSHEGPPQGYEPLDAYSIFIDSHRSDDYEKAIRFGRWIWKDMPETMEGYSGFDLERNMGRLADIYTEYANEQDDPSLKSAYLDTAIIIYDKVFENMSEEIDLFEWHFDRGRFYQSNSSNIDGGMDKATEDYMKAYELNPEKFTKQADGYYIRIILRNMVANERKEEALSLIEETSEYAPEPLEESFDEIRNELFDTPEERIDFLNDQISEEPENEKLIRELRDIYEDEGMREETQEMNIKLYELNPSFENTKALAEFSIDNSEYQDAIKYLKEAISKADDANEKADMAMELSSTYRNIDDLEQAREAARQAMDFRPDWGRPYMQIATIYADAVSDCTSNRDMTKRDRAVYWLVIDYLNEAKGIDSSVSNAANRQIKSYSSALPNAEDIHFTSEWTEGEDITVGSSLNECYAWINESTTVRTQ